MLMKNLAKRSHAVENRMHFHPSNVQAIHRIVGKNSIQEVIRMSIHCLIHGYFVVSIISSNLVEFKWCLKDNIPYPSEIAEMKLVRTLLVISICKQQPIAK